MKHVYAVGSWNKRHFIVDRIFSEDAKEEAIEYCEKRKTDKYEWSVFKAPLNDVWFKWSRVRTVERSE